MKTTMLSVLTTTLLGFVLQAGGHSFDAADFTAILFATGLVAWTINQYNQPARPLTVAQPIRVPVSLGVRHAPVSSRQLAA